MVPPWGHMHVPGTSMDMGLVVKDFKMSPGQAHRHSTSHSQGDYMACEAGSTAGLGNGCVAHRVQTLLQEAMDDAP